MRLSLYTDCLSDHPLEQAMDITAGLGVTAVELPVGDTAHLPPDRVADLLADPAALSGLVDALAARGQRVVALNCSAWVRRSASDEELLDAVGSTLRLARALDVDTVVSVSGCPGTAPAIRALDWYTVARPRPRDYHLELEAQWQQGVATWRRLAEAAAQQGVRRLALELHPLQLVSGTSTLTRFREDVGPVIGACVDPASMTWQQMDPLKVVQALGSAVAHVHLRDVEVHPEFMALNGAVLTTTPMEEPRQRSWTFRTVGLGRDGSFWEPFLAAVRDTGYDGWLSLANRDPYLPQHIVIGMAERFVSGVLDALEPQGAPS